MRAGKTEACLLELEFALLKGRVDTVESDLINHEVDLERRFDRLTLDEDLDMHGQRINELEDWRANNSNAMASFGRRQSQIADIAHDLQDTVRQHRSRIVQLEQVQGDNASLRQDYSESRANDQAQQLQMALQIEVLSEQQQQSVAELRSRLDTLSGNQDHAAHEIAHNIQGLSQSLDHVNARLGEVGEASETSIGRVRQEAMGRLTEPTDRLRSCSTLVSDLAANDASQAETLNTLAAFVQRGIAVFDDLGINQEAQRLRLDEYGMACAFMAERVDHAMSGNLSTSLSRAIKDILVQVRSVVNLQSTRAATLSEQASTPSGQASAPLEQPATSVPPASLYASPPVQFGHLPPIDQHIPPLAQEAAPTNRQPSMVQPHSPPTDSHGHGLVIINGRCDNVVVVSGTGDTRANFAPAAHGQPHPSIRHDDRTASIPARGGFKRCHRRYLDERCPMLNRLAFGETRNSFWLCSAHS